MQPIDEQLLTGPNTTRYLIDFHPKLLSHYFTDVLIIGGGLAGLRAANAVNGNQRVIVVTKDKVQESNSNYAQGGIASVWDPEDRFEDHVQDTLTAGGSLCDKLCRISDRAVLANLHARGSLSSTSAVLRRLQPTAA